MQSNMLLVRQASSYTAKSQQPPPEPTDCATLSAGVPAPRCSCPVRSAEGGQKESRRAAGPRARALAGVLVSTRGGDASGDGVTAGERGTLPTTQNGAAPATDAAHVQITSCSERRAKLLHSSAAKRSIT